MDKGLAEAPMEVDSDNENDCMTAVQALVSMGARHQRMN